MQNTLFKCLVQHLSIDPYKLYQEECLSVCLSFMHSVPVIATATTKRGGGRRLSENSSSIDKLSVPRFSLELWGPVYCCDALKRSEYGCLDPKLGAAMPGLDSQKTLNLA